MKNFIILTVVLSMIILLVSCKMNESSNKSGKKTNELLPDREVEIDTSNIDFVDPDNLYEGMTRQVVEEEFGEPIDSLGAGLSILVYMADKEHMLVLYFDPRDKYIKLNL